MLVEIVLYQLGNNSQIQSLICLAYINHALYKKIFH